MFEALYEFSWRMVEALGLVTVLLVGAKAAEKIFQWLSKV